MKAAKKLTGLSLCGQTQAFVPAGDKDGAVKNGQYRSLGASARWDQNRIYRTTFYGGR
jgi:hypothetical protein